MWFYYSGNISKPIPVKKGLSISVRPHTKIEITEPGIREVQALIRKGLLRRTGRPVGVKPVEDMPTTTPEDIIRVTPKSELARKFAEKGVTKSKSQTPKKKGSVEMTEGELEVVDKVESVKVESDSGTESDVISSGADSVEVLSKADRSSDAIQGSDGDSKAKKGRKRRKN